VYHCEGISELELSGALLVGVLNNRLSIGALPGELEFTGQGHVEREFAQISGKLKNEVYSAHELLEVRNP